MANKEKDQNIINVRLKHIDSRIQWSIKLFYGILIFIFTSFAYILKNSLIDNFWFLLMYTLLIGYTFLIIVTTIESRIDNLHYELIEHIKKGKIPNVNIKDTFWRRNWRSLYQIFNITKYTFLTLIILILLFLLIRWIITLF